MEEERRREAKKESLMLRYQEKVAYEIFDREVAGSIFRDCSRGRKRRGGWRST
jgi:hypothetical protein